ncbi:hypothetical protein CASFOL_016727 [Castilleja foliolosa]|uniref:Uncharacterized protein n=1 Tax=Castilleja foliolosa TaxID=1961234 RepID=A0ABD3D918_9LAMI
MNIENMSEEDQMCYFHPKELVIGICALCLKQKLLVLASKQKPHFYSAHKNYLLPKIFAITSLINPLEFKHHKSDQVYDDDNDDDDGTNYSSTSSQEDSFISIKFEDNGVASWDKGKIISKISNDHQKKNAHEISWADDDQCNSLDIANKIKSVVEHDKPRAKLRWRKRIGHLLHLIKWRRSDTCQVGTKLEGAKVKGGWIRILTKRRTKE